jgi:hypothetical protein
MQEVARVGPTPVHGQPALGGIVGVGALRLPDNNEGMNWTNVFLK